MTPARVSAATARRLLLAAQGLADDPRQRVTADSLYALILRLGFVQVDSIRTVERAHHLILSARLSGYREEHLDRLLAGDRRLFEHWTHDAAVIPTAFLPHWLPRFARYRERALAHPWWKERMGPEPGRVIAEVEERLRQDGPLLVRDFEEEPGAPPAAGETGWWGWRPQKAALEFLWRSGRAAIAHRVHFHKVYDLAERVFPHLPALAPPTPEEHREWACREALERLGVATPRELADFWQAVPVAEAQAWCEAALREGRVEPVEVETADDSPPYRAFAVTDWRERAASAPQPPARMRILAPFDPILRDRRRTLRLFGFDYRFEAFVPAAKRQYGYYVMPLLAGDRLVGRIDPKLHRDRGELAISGVWWEPGQRSRPAALEAAVARLARFLQAETWTIA
jgi:uncharacterized protein YcaQ